MEDKKGKVRRIRVKVRRIRVGSAEDMGWGRRMRSEVRSITAQMKPKHEALCSVHRSMLLCVALTM